MCIHRIANEMLTALGASSKVTAEWASKIARLQHAIFGSASKGEGATRRFLAHQRSLHAGYLPSSKAKAWFGVFP
jgi:hypothetical protein